MDNDVRWEDKGEKDVGITRILSYNTTKDVPKNAVFHKAEFLKSLSPLTYSVKLIGRKEESVKTFRKKIPKSLNGPSGEIVIPNINVTTSKSSGNHITIISIPMTNKNKKSGETVPRILDLIFQLLSKDGLGFTEHQMERIRKYYGITDRRDTLEPFWKRQMTSRFGNSSSLGYIAQYPVQGVTSVSFDRDTSEGNPTYNLIIYVEKDSKFYILIPAVIEEGGKKIYMDYSANQENIHINLIPEDYTEEIIPIILEKMFSLFDSQNMEFTEEDKEHIRDYLGVKKNKIIFPSKMSFWKISIPAVGDRYLTLVPEENNKKNDYSITSVKFISENPNDDPRVVINGDEKYKINDLKKKLDGDLKFSFRKVEYRLSVVASPSNSGKQLIVYLINRYISYNFSIPEILNHIFSVFSTIGMDFDLKQKEAIKDHMDVNTYLEKQAKTTSVESVLEKKDSWVFKENKNTIISGDSFNVLSYKPSSPFYEIQSVDFRMNESKSCIFVIGSMNKDNVPLFMKTFPKKIGINGEHVTIQSFKKPKSNVEGMKILLYNNDFSDKDLFTYGVLENFFTHCESLDLSFSYSQVNNIREHYGVDHLSFSESPDSESASNSPIVTPDIEPEETTVAEEIWENTENVSYPDSEALEFTTKKELPYGINKIEFWRKKYYGDEDCINIYTAEDDAAVENIRRKFNNFVRADKNSAIDSNQNLFRDCLTIDVKPYNKNRSAETDELLFTLFYSFAQENGFGFTEEQTKNITEFFKEILDNPDKLVRVQTGTIWINGVKKEDNKQRYKHLSYEAKNDSNYGLRTFAFSKPEPLEYTDVGNRTRVSEIKINTNKSEDVYKLLHRSVRVDDTPLSIESKVDGYDVLINLDERRENTSLIVKTILNDLRSANIGFTDREEDKIYKFLDLDSKIRDEIWQYVSQDEEIRTYQVGENAYELVTAEFHKCVLGRDDYLLLKSSNDDSLDNFRETFETNQDMRKEGESLIIYLNTPGKSIKETGKNNLSGVIDAFKKVHFIFPNMEEILKFFNWESLDNNNNTKWTYNSKRYKTTGKDGEHEYLSYICGNGNNGYDILTIEFNKSTENKSINIVSSSSKIGSLIPKHLNHSYDKKKHVMQIIVSADTSHTLWGNIESIFKMFENLYMNFLDKEKEYILMNFFKLKKPVEISPVKVPEKAPEKKKQQKPLPRSERPMKEILEGISVHKKVLDDLKDSSTKTLLEYYSTSKTVDEKNLIKLACFLGDTALVKKLHNDKNLLLKDAHLWRDCTIAAALGGKNFTLTYLFQVNENLKNKIRVDDLCVYAAMSGNVDCLNIANTSNQPKGHALLASVVTGQFETFKYCVDEKFPIHSGTVGFIVNNQYYEYLTYLTEKRIIEWPQGLTLDAAKLGNYNILDHLYSHGCDFDINTCHGAAYYGHIDCLAYAHDNGAHWNSNTMINAVDASRTDSLQFLLSEGCPYDDIVMKNAAEKGFVDGLKILREFGKEWEEDVMTSAVLGGQMNTVRYLHENGCPWGKKVTFTSATSNHIDILKYCIDNGCEWDRTWLLLQAGNKDFDVIYSYLLSIEPRDEGKYYSKPIVQMNIDRNDVMGLYNKKSYKCLRYAYLYYRITGNQAIPKVEKVLSQ